MRLRDAKPGAIVRVRPAAYPFNGMLGQVTGRGATEAAIRVRFKPGPLQRANRGLLPDVASVFSARDLELVRKAETIA